MFFLLRHVKYAMSVGHSKWKWWAGCLGLRSGGKSGVAEKDLGVVGI